MIRIATKEDTYEVALLAIKIWHSSTIEELQEGFEEAVRSSRSEVIVLEEKEEIVGVAQCGLRHDYVEGTKSSPVGYLEGIIVEEAYRKRGYAKALLTKCEEWAREKGCSEFASDCELDNAESLAFHLSMGFEEANRIICFTKKL